MASPEIEKHFERPTTQSQDFPLVKRVIYMVLVSGLGVTTGAFGFLIAGSQTPVDQYANYPSGPSIDRLQPQAAGRAVIDATTVARVQTVAIVRPRNRMADQYDQLIDPAEYIGSGVVATSDGWIMTSIPSAQLNKVEVVIRGSIFTAAKVATDALTGISFLKIDARSLTPVTVADGVGVGDMVVAVGASTGSAPRPTLARVVQNGYMPIRSKLDYVNASDTLGAYALLDGSVSPGAASAYFTGEGTFAGFALVKNEELLLVPSALTRLSLEQALRQEAPRDLGIYYMNNSSLAADRRLDGIRVYHPARSPIRAGSLAEKAGLHINDIIRSIGGDAISEDASFDYLWKKHQQDSNGVQLVIVRDGVEGPLQISW